MLLEKKDGMRKRKKGGIVVGYDMNDEYAQISYCFSDKEEIETLAVVAGTKQYSIPMVLCRKKETKMTVWERSSKVCERGRGLSRGKAGKPGQGHRAGGCRGRKL